MQTPLEHILTSAMKEGMLNYMAAHPNDFGGGLIELAVSNKQPYSWRAAWLLWSCMERNDRRVEKHISTIADILDKLGDGHQRNLINLLLKMKIKEEHEGKLFDVCVNIWTRIEKQPSVRYKAFELIIQLAKKYPDLLNEVKAIVQEHYVDSLSEGIKRSLYKKINSLK